MTYGVKYVTKDNLVQDNIKEDVVTIHFNLSEADFTELVDELDGYYLRKVERNAKQVYKARLYYVPEEYHDKNKKTWDILEVMSMDRLFRLKVTNNVESGDKSITNLTQLKEYIETRIKEYESNNKIK